MGARIHDRRSGSTRELDPLSVTRVVRGDGRSLALLFENGAWRGMETVDSLGEHWDSDAAVRAETLEQAARLDPALSRPFLQRALDDAALTPRAAVLLQRLG